MIPLIAPVQPSGHAKRRSRQTVLVAGTVAVAACVVAGCGLPDDDTPRELACEWGIALDAKDFTGKRVDMPLPPHVIERFVIEENTADAIVFRVTYDEFPPPNNPPNEQFILKPLTTVSIRLGKDEEFDSIKNNFYRVEIPIEDGDLYQSDEGNAFDVKPQNTTVQQDGKDLVVSIDPTEFPGLAAGKKFPIDATTSFAGDGIEKRPGPTKVNWQNCG